MSPDYKKATNAAYRVLAKKSAFSIPTNVFAVVEELLPNCKLLTYSQACYLYRYPKHVLLCVSEYGFSIVRGDKRIILYNEAMPIGCIRFTIAHEIGHNVLGHRSEKDECAEKEANCFARNLLCPVPVSCRISSASPKDYSNMFNITVKMAEVAVEKHFVDKYNISEDLFSRISDMYTAFVFGFPSIHEYYQAFAS